jgi:serine/threonine protein kinase
MLEEMQERSFAVGDALIRQDDPGDSLLVVVQGTAGVSVRDQHGVVRRIGEVRQGDVVGEMALVTGEQRSADVIAEQPLRALALAAEDYHGLARRNPELGVVLTHVIADRLGRSEWDSLGGKLLQGYRILRCVGRGGMAMVYEAEPETGARRVALKMMSHRLVYDPVSLARFREEANVVETLEHPNIARLFGRFSAYGTHFLIMEFCDGPGLDQLLSQKKPLPEPQVRRIVGQLASAVDYVHRRGLLHGDVKAGNVKLNSDGLVKLMDFGLARPTFDLSDRTQTLEITVVGTPHYMAPEQFGGTDFDSRVDIYALACLTYMMLAARRLFKASNIVELIRNKLTLRLPPREQIGLGISAEMHEFLEKGLRPDPEQRLESLKGYAPWAGPVELDALGI